MLTTLCCILFEILVGPSLRRLGLESCSEASFRCGARAVVTIYTCCYIHALAFSVFFLGTSAAALSLYYDEVHAGLLVVTHRLGPLGGTTGTCLVPRSQNNDPWPSGGGWNGVGTRVSVPRRSSRRIWNASPPSLLRRPPARGSAAGVIHGSAEVCCMWCVACRLVVVVVVEVEVCVCTKHCTGCSSSCRPLREASFFAWLLQSRLLLSLLLLLLLIPSHHSKKTLFSSSLA